MFSKKINPDSAGQGLRSRPAAAENVQETYMLTYLVSNILLSILYNFIGAQWLSGRVLDSRPRGRGFEPHRCH